MQKMKLETIPISDNLYTIAICAVRYALGLDTVALRLYDSEGNLTAQRLIGRER